MIQPVSAFSPRAEFRGKSSKQGQKIKEPRTKSEIGLLNGGVASGATACIVTLISRNHTSNWGNAAVLGILSGIITMSFIAPSLIDKTNIYSSKKKSKETQLGEASFVRNNLKQSTRKLVQFKQSEKSN